jgi:hypothetical protein
MTNSATLKAASKELAKATLRIRKMDRGLSERLVKALAAEMDRIQRGE